MSAPSSESIIAAVLAFIGGGGIVAVINGWFTRPKTNAEAKLAEANADKIIITSAMEFVNTLKADISALRSDMNLLEKKIDVLETHIRVQATFISRLRTVVEEVKPDHPILTENVPILHDA